MDIRFQDLIEIPNYGNPKRMEELYQKSKQRQQQSIIATCRGLMLMNERKWKK